MSGFSPQCGAVQLTISIRRISVTSTTVSFAASLCRCSLLSRSLYFVASPARTRGQLHNILAVSSLAIDNIVSRLSFSLLMLNAYSDMWDAHPVQTPLAPVLRLIKADCPAREAIDPALHHRCRSIVGSIGYLVQMTRCDLAFAFTQLSQSLHFSGCC